jgi:hypothetical protein
MVSPEREAVFSYSATSHLFPLKYAKLVNKMDKEEIKKRKETCLANLKESDEFFTIAYTAQNQIWWSVTISDDVLIGILTPFLEVLKKKQKDRFAHLMSVTKLPERDAREVS